MESPVRKLLKRNDYQRHKLFRKIKRKRKARLELDLKIAERELRKKLKLPKFDDGSNSQDQQVVYTQPTPQDLVSYVPRSRITFTDDGKFILPSGEEVSVPLDEVVVQTKGGRPLTKVQEEIAKYNLLKQGIIDESGNQVKDTVYDSELDIPLYLKEKPLEQVSPEFYLLTAGAGAANGAVSNVARGFMNYMSDPIVQNITLRTAASMMGGLGTDMAMQATTGNTWGQAVNQLSLGYIPEWVGDMTNPGYFTESIITNGGNRLLNLSKGINFVSGLTKGDIVRNPIKNNYFNRIVEITDEFNPIQDAINTGIIRSHPKSQHPFPFFSYGRYNNPSFNIKTGNKIIIQGEQSDVLPFVRVNDFNDNVYAALAKNLGESATPLYNGSLNTAPANLFWYYQKGNGLIGKHFWYKHKFDTPDIPNRNNSGKDIHIDKNKRGTFTRAAKARGMGVQEFAHKVLSAPKGKYSSNMRKKANFARNASKFKH